jgi:hypothetical protein
VFHGAVFPEEHVLPFDRAPKPLDENIVEGAPSSIQADADAATFQNAQPFRAGKLALLVSVESPAGVGSLMPAPRRPRKRRSPSSWKVPTR